MSMFKLPSLHKTILLIDDDEDDCYLFQLAVKEVSNCYNVNCTNNTENLIAILENTKPSIIFIDLHLSRHSGLDCLKQIRAISAYEHVPVVFWSGCCVDQHISLVYSEGAQYYFEKPACIRCLIEEVKSILYAYNLLDNIVSGSTGGKLFNCQLSSYA